MKRKDFFRKGLLGISAAFVAPTVLSSCKKDEETPTSTIDSACATSPTETKGPFPIKTPSEQVKSNIISDRTGIPVEIRLTIKNNKNSCNPLVGALVDVWHCDKDGNYSEYGGTQMQQTDYTAVHFLRGRQTTDTNGMVSFLSIYPGWYQGRAPHIHVEILTASGSSLLVTQIAFPENTSSVVYASTAYASHGQADTSNSNDNVFSDSLSKELATLMGNNTDGYVLTHTINVGV